MAGWQLTLKQTPELRIRAEALQPAALAALDEAAVLRVGLPMARETLALGELFTVRRLADAAVPRLLIEGDLRRFDGLGAELAEGELQVQGDVGHQAGQGLSGGRLHISGAAGELAGCAMSGGTLDIGGSVGDFAGGALPGEMNGMTGGTLIVRGAAGARLADRMRRGTVVVLGDVGDYTASRLVAGTVALAGRCGAHPGVGMRRGTLVFAGPKPDAACLGPTFVPVRGNADVFWQLLARDLAQFGEPFDGLARRRLQRLAGDQAVQGLGEVLLPD